MTAEFARALVAGLLFCGGAGAIAQNVPGRSAALEESVRKEMNIPAGIPIEYHIAKGKPVDAEAFAVAASQPGNALMVERKRGRVILRLKESKAAPASDFTHLPALEARDLTGRPVRHLHLDGKHTLLSFYFSDCAPCVQEVPALNAYRAAHPELNYLAITFDPAANARQFVSERKFNWPVVADAGRFLKAAGVRHFPGYMLVAPDGRIVGRGAGLTFHAQEETPGLASLEKFVDRQLKTPK